MRKNVYAAVKNSAGGGTGMRKFTTIVYMDFQLLISGKSVRGFSYSVYTLLKRHLSAAIKYTKYAQNVVHTRRRLNC